MVAQPKFDYQGALDEGYSDDEITSFLSKQHPTFDIKSAQSEGYSPNEINQFLSTHEPENKERSTLEKAGRIGAQVALGAAEMAALPYELGVALPLSSPSYYHNLSRQRISEDMEYLSDKNMGTPYKEWPEEDREKYDFLHDRLLNPQKISEDVKDAPMKIGIRDIAEKVTGIDFHPEGVLEKAASWIGFIKSPMKVKELASMGLNPKKVMETLGVSGTDIARGAAAGTALQMAEEGEYGPLGTITAAIIGDFLGHAPKALVSIAKNPKQVIAEMTNLLTGKKQKELVQQIIEDANKSGIQLDAGTLTNSNLVRAIQARAAQSSLTGNALENFQKQLSEQFVEQYKSIVEKLGESSFENNYQASESIKNFLKNEENTLFQQYGPKGETPAPSLKGRIAVEQEPVYQQEFLNRIAPQEVESTYQAGENLKTAAEDIKAPIKEGFNRKWDVLNKEIEAIPAGPQSQLANVMEAFVRDNEGSLLLGESTAEARVLRAAEELKNRLMTPEGAFIGVSLRDLMKTKRTLGDVANWEFGGSNFQSQYKNLVGQIDQAIERTLQEVNPEIRTVYETLNSEYSAYKDLFENKNILPLFEPKNQNYNAIYNQFSNNPDKLRSLEDIFYTTPRGTELVNQVKRDYAQKVIEKPNLTARDLRDLEAVLGPESQPLVQEYVIQRQRAIDRPGPRAAQGKPLGAEVPLAENKGMGKAPVEKGRAKTAFPHERQKLYEYLSKKNPDQIMNMMSSVEDIRRLKKAMNLTPEGRELFERLSRYKITEMIDNHMKDALKENINLNKFSKLAETTKEKSILKELIGDEAYKRFELLQKNAGRISQSANKFYNASKSGTTLADIGLASTMISGIMTANPYMALGAAASIGGMNVAARLLSNAEFLKFLEQSVLTNNKEKFKKIMESMKPHVQDAIVNTMMEQSKEQEGF